MNITKTEIIQCIRRFSSLDYTYDLLMNSLKKRIEDCKQEIENKKKDIEIIEATIKFLEGKEDE